MNRSASSLLPSKPGVDRHLCPIPSCRDGIAIAGSAATSIPSSVVRSLLRRSPILRRRNRNSRFFPADLPLCSAFSRSKTFWRRLFSHPWFYPPCQASLLGTDHMRAVHRRHERGRFPVFRGKTTPTRVMRYRCYSSASDLFLSLPSPFVLNGLSLIGCPFLSNLTWLSGCVSSKPWAYLV